MVQSCPNRPSLSQLMRRVSRLSTLEDIVTQRTRKLGERAALLAKSGPVEHYSFEAETAAIVLGLLNSWQLTARCFVVSSALGTKTTDGRWLQSPLQLQSENDVIGAAIQVRKPNAQPNAQGIWNSRDEPTWHSPSVILDATKYLSIPNNGTFSAAFSFGFRVFQDLPTMRNYFAHRNEVTHARARALAPKYLLPPSRKPSAWLNQRPPTQHSSVLEDWIAELTLTTEELLR